MVQAFGLWRLAQATIVKRVFKVDLSGFVLRCLRMVDLGDGLHLIIEMRCVIRLPFIVNLDTSDTTSNRIRYI